MLCATFAQLLKTPFNLAFGAARSHLHCQRKPSTLTLVSSGFLPFIPDFTMFTLMFGSRGIRVCSFLGRKQDHPTCLLTERNRNVMEQGPTCPTCHVQCRGEPLLLAGSRLVIKYSASLSNTKSLYTPCVSPLVAAGEASACWGRKSELAGRAGRKKRQERVGQEHKSSNVISLKGNSCSFSSQPHESPLPIRSRSYRGAKQLIPSAQLPNR